MFIKKTLFLFAYDLYLIYKRIYIYIYIYVILSYLRVNMQTTLITDIYIYHNNLERYYKYIS